MQKQNEKKTIQKHTTNINMEEKKESCIYKIYIHANETPKINIFQLYYATHFCWTTLYCHSFQSDRDCQNETNKNTHTQNIYEIITIINYRQHNVVANEMNDDNNGDDERKEKKNTQNAKYLNVKGKLSNSDLLIFKRFHCHSFSPFVLFVSWSSHDIINTSM